jgi:hypothetical protein
VLGLVVQSTGRGVLVTWSRPSVSDHVRIVRFPGLSGSRFAVVYDGRRASYLDRRVEDGGVYRYVIRNYDAHGRASTGVTAVVVAERL